MKAILLSLSLFLIGAAAEATQTVNLGPEACTATNICFNVPNDAGLTIEYISNAIQYRRIVIAVNGEIYDSGLWAVTSWVDTPLYAANGSVIYSTLAFSIVTGKCIQEGRVCVAPKHVTLTSGTLLLP